MMSPGGRGAASGLPLLPTIHMMRRREQSGGVDGMEIQVRAGDIAASDAACIVVNLFEGVSVPGGGTGAVDRALAGMISELIASGDIRGKWGELTLLHTRGRLPAPR